MRRFIAMRGLDHPERREKLADGAPGLAVSIDLETYDRRRTAMLALLKAASGADTFGAWLKHSESIAARRTEKLDSYLEVLYMLLSDVLRIYRRIPAGRNADIARSSTLSPPAYPSTGFAAPSKRWMNWWNWYAGIFRNPSPWTHGP